MPLEAVGLRRKAAALILTLMTTTGCVSVTGVQKPIAASDLHVSVCPSAKDLKDFEKLIGPARRNFRDDTILDCIKAIDRKYVVFKSSLQTERVSTNLAADVLALGLTSGAALAKGGTATALAGAGGIVLGIGTAINKDVFYQQALPAVEASMDAKRDGILKAIIDAEKSDPGATSYTLASAGFDIDSYERAGNLYGAIAELTKAASVTADKAKDDVAQSQKLKSFAYTAVDLPANTAVRARKFTSYIRALQPKDRAKLDAIAGALGLTPDPAEAFDAAQVDAINAVIEQASTGEPDAAIAAVEAKLTPLMK